MKKLILLILLISIFISCTDRIDYFQVNSDIPLFEIRNQNGIYSTYLADSHKTWQKDKYMLYYNFEDNDGLEKITAEFKQGAGTIEYDIDSIIYLDCNLGINKISLSCFDVYNKAYSSLLELYVFENLLPVAEFKYAYINNAMIIDASSSYDMDEKFGGKIVLYEVTVNNITVSAKTSKVELSMYINEPVDISVRVKDNNQEWSKYKKQIFEP